MILLKRKNGNSYCHKIDSTSIKDSRGAGGASGGEMMSKFHDPGDFRDFTNETVIGSHDSPLSVIGPGHQLYLEDGHQDSQGFIRALNVLSDKLDVQILLKWRVSNPYTTPSLRLDPFADLLVLGRITKHFLRPDDGTVEFVMDNGRKGVFYPPKHPGCIPVPADE